MENRPDILANQERVTVNWVRLKKAMDRIQSRQKTILEAIDKRAQETGQPNISAEEADNLQSMEEEMEKIKVSLNKIEEFLLSVEQEDIN